MKSPVGSCSFEGMACMETSRPDGWRNSTLAPRTPPPGRVKEETEQRMGVEWLEWDIEFGGQSNA